MNYPFFVAANRNMNLPTLALTVALFTAGAGACGAADGAAPPEVARFSSGQPGEVLPAGWQAWTLSYFKKPTSYRLVSEDGRIVMKASAEAAASGLMHGVRVDLREFPVLRWSWKVNELIATADNTNKQLEDSPVRLVVAFAGDNARLPFRERMFAMQIMALTGRDLPYATLMYIWENRAPRESVIPSQHTPRIKMVVARSGRDGLGKWLEESHNVYEDYKRAFGEEPPMIQSIGILTDTDNTGAVARAYYGDISFIKGGK
jgi:hypothetical protein